jgi:A/G-specific adenine glycosylase
LKGTVQQLPVKEKKITKKTRWLYYLRIDFEGETYVRKRGASDIWENLYEFVLIESLGPIFFNDLAPFKALLEKNKFTIVHISPLYKQLLTHQTIHGQFARISVKEPLVLKGYKKINRKALGKLPFPKFISNYLTDKNVPLNLF